MNYPKDAFPFPFARRSESPRPAAMQAYNPVAALCRPPPYMCMLKKQGTTTNNTNSKLPWTVKQRRPLMPLCSNAVLTCARSAAAYYSVATLQTRPDVVQHRGTCSRNIDRRKAPKSPERRRATVRKLSTSCPARAEHRSDFGRHWPFWATTWPNQTKLHKNMSDVGRTGLAIVLPSLAKLGPHIAETQGNIDKHVGNGSKVDLGRPEFGPTRPTLFGCWQKSATMLLKTARCGPNLDRCSARGDLMCCSFGVARLATRRLRALLRQSVCRRPRRHHWASSAPWAGKPPEFQAAFASFAAGSPKVTKGARRGAAAGACRRGRR